MSDQPFQAGTLVSVPNGQLLGVAVVTTVPAGKRLVIEFVSALVFVPAAQHVVELSLQSPPGSYSHYLTPVPLGRNGLNDEFVASQSLRLYANAGQRVQVAVSRTGSNGPASALVSLSGVLVDVP
jgi:hypothetical protein